MMQAKLSVEVSFSQATDAEDIRAVHDTAAACQVGWPRGFHTITPDELREVLGIVGQLRDRLAAIAAAHGHVPPAPIVVHGNTSFMGGSTREPGKHD
jgi:hypothetical protein